MLGRLEKYRGKRQYRRCLILSVTLFWVILISGIWVSDYTINSMMGRRHVPGVFRISSQGHGLYRVDILGYKFKADFSSLNFNLFKR